MNLSSIVSQFPGPANCASALPLGADASAPALQPGQTRCWWSDWAAHHTAIACFFRLLLAPQSPFMTLCFTHYSCFLQVLYTVHLTPDT